MTWFNIIATITKLTKLDEFTIDTCGNALECKFEPTSPNRYRSDTLQRPFEYAELITGSDKTVLILILRDEPVREEYAMRMLSLGKPIDIDTVSPPMADENSSGANMDWDRKYNLCYEIGDRQVWFGIEAVDSQKKLLSVMLNR